MSDIQEGINWYEGAKPKKHFKLLVFKISNELSTPEIKLHLGKIWGVIQSIKNGISPTLGSTVLIDPAEIEALICYGHSLYDLTGLNFPAPEGLSTDESKFPEPVKGAKTSVIPGSGIKYQDDVAFNSANGQIAIQLTANSVLSLSRTQIEIQRYLNSIWEDRENQFIKIFGIFDGFGREDKRSWIDFHDGISNLKKGEMRRQAIAIKPENAGGKDWSLNGTYMVFMKLVVDLDIWQKLSLNEQEILVGRKKHTGCPIISFGNEGIITDSRCPIAGTTEIIDNGNEQFHQPSQFVSKSIQMSHVQRSNKARTSPAFRTDSRRIYRQGFEFLEPSSNEQGYNAGLNFISFQDDPSRTLFILENPDWLGNLSFGGDPNFQENGIDRLISARAAGTFYVPPFVQGELFPGENIFQ